MRSASVTTCRFEPPAARRAFTLIELLIVMAIIVTLAGFVTFASVHLWSIGPKKRAEGNITILAAALEDFKRLYGSYPYHDPADDTVPPPKKLSGPITPVADPETFDIRNLYYVLRDTACLRDPWDAGYITKKGAAGNDSDFVVNDGYGRPLVYRYPRTAADGQFDLWSMGPDGQDSRAAKADTINPADMSNDKNSDNIVWGAFEKR